MVIALYKHFLFSNQKSLSTAPNQKKIEFQNSVRNKDLKTVCFFWE